MPSLIVDMFLFILILLNVTAVCLESVSFIREKYSNTFFYFEIISVIIFSIEYILRVWSAPSLKSKTLKTPSRKRRISGLKGSRRCRCSNLTVNYEINCSFKILSSRLCSGSNKSCEESF